VSFNFQIYIVQVNVNDSNLFKINSRFSDKISCFSINSIESDLGIFFRFFVSYILFVKEYIVIFKYYRKIIKSYLLILNLKRKLK